MQLLQGSARVYISFSSDSDCASLEGSRFLLASFHSLRTQPAVLLTICQPDPRRIEFFKEIPVKEGFERSLQVFFT